MIRFSEYIVEELTPKQKTKVDNWSAKGRNIGFSDHAMGGKDRVVIPLHTDDPVKDHLEKSGYKVDRDKGVAIDKHNRSNAIGRALKKTGAPEDLMLRHNRDSARQVKFGSNANHEIVISRHPHDVAGMSTDRAWDSCMDMDHGENNDFLPKEIKNGTHVAYLVNKGDHEAKEPIARIALKPFHHEKDKSDTILRPEGRTYGHGGDAFGASVRGWTEHHFPLKEKAVYQKAKTSYDDDDNSVAFKNTDSTINHLVQTSKHPQVIDVIVNNGSKDHVKALAQRGLDNKIPGYHYKTVESAIKRFKSEGDHESANGLIDSAYKHKDNLFTHMALKHMDTNDSRIHSELNSPGKWDKKLTIMSLKHHNTPDKISTVLKSLHDNKGSSNSDDSYYKHRIFDSMSQHMKGPENRDNRLSAVKHDYYNNKTYHNAKNIVSADIDDVGISHSSILKDSISHPSRGAKDGAIAALGDAYSTKKVQVAAALEKHNSDYNHPEVKKAIAGAKQTLDDSKPHFETALKNHFNDRDTGYMKGDTTVSGIAFHTPHPDQLLKLAQHQDDNVRSIAKESIEAHYNHAKTMTWKHRGPDDKTPNITRAAAIDPVTGHDWGKTLDEVHKR